MVRESYDKEGRYRLNAYDFGNHGRRTPEREEQKTERDTQRRKEQEETSIDDGKGCLLSLVGQAQPILMERKDLSCAGSPMAAPTS